MSAWGRDREQERGQRKRGRDMQGRSLLQSDPNLSLVIRLLLAFRQQWEKRVESAYTNSVSLADHHSKSHSRSKQVVAHTCPSCGSHLPPHLGRLFLKSFVSNPRQCWASFYVKESAICEPPGESNNYPTITSHNFAGPRANKTISNPNLSNQIWFNIFSESQNVFITVY